MSHFGELMTIEFKDASESVEMTDDLNPIDRLAQLLVSAFITGGSGFFPDDIINELEDLPGDPWEEARKVASKELEVNLKVRYDCMAPDYFDVWVWESKE